MPADTAARTGYLGGVDVSVGVLLALRPVELRDQLLTGVAEGDRSVAAVLSIDHESIGTTAPFVVTSASAGWRLQGLHSRCQC